MQLPADSHVHSEWSWDAEFGSMAATCAKAVELGLPAIAFTEHVDHTQWLIRADDLAAMDHLQKFATDDGLIAPTQFDVQGYLASVAECRDRYPSLKIITGVELGEPHRHPVEVARLLATGSFARVLGSLHSLPHGSQFSEPPYLYGVRQADRVVRDYLAEVARLIKQSDVFSVLAHIDYPLRNWPDHAEPLDLIRFEDEFRHAMQALASTDRTLELNTNTQLRPELVRWWKEEGGMSITFGSDAHSPAKLAQQFELAVTIAEQVGFRAGEHPWDFWTC